jgi:hypothetical protein
VERVFREAPNERRERALASTRLVIESVFSKLKEQMRLERHLARTPAGRALRIAQRILALTLGILLNTINGRPARARGEQSSIWTRCEHQRAGHPALVVDPTIAQHDDDRGVRGQAPAHDTYESPKPSRYAQRPVRTGHRG